MLAAHQNVRSWICRKLIETIDKAETLSTTLIEDGVNTTDGILGTLNLDKVDGFLDTGVASLRGKWG